MESEEEFQKAAEFKVPMIKSSAQASELVELVEKKAGTFSGT